MKVYIASSFRLIDKVINAAEKIEGAGFEISEKWWAREYHIPGEGIVKTTDLKERYETDNEDTFYNRPETRLSFLKDFNGVKGANIFLFIADDTPRKYNGANVELGIALGKNIPCYCVGSLEKSVLYYRVKRCGGISYFIEAIK